MALWSCCCCCSWNMNICHPMCVNDMHVFLPSKLFTHLSLCKCRQIYKLRYIRFDNMLWATQKNPSRFLLRFTFPLFFHKTAQAQKNIIFCFTPVQAINHYHQKQSSGAVMLVLGWKNKKMNAGTVIAFLWISCCNSKVIEENTELTWKDDIV